MFADLLREQLGSIIELSPLQTQQLERHFELLVRWNQVLNLTSVRNPDEIVERHYCESLFLATCLPPGTLRIGDLGSGAGFPGVPLAIAKPEYSVTLIEAHQRKAVFLREVSRALPNIRVLASRAEKLKDSFDWVVSRAVRFSEIEKPLANLAPNIAVLGGAEPPLAGRFTWNTPIALPWGDQRKLWIGSLRST